MMRRIFFFSLAVFSLSACEKKEAVIAKVGPLHITQADFQKALSDVAPGYQNYVMTPNGRRQFLDIIIRDKLELAAAEFANPHLEDKVLKFGDNFSIKGGRHFPAFYG